MEKFSKITENSSYRFSIGLDFHGVIDSMPEFFSFLTNSIIDSGGEVHILTGSSWSEELESQLKSFNVRYTHKFSVYDHLMQNGTKIVGKVKFPDGTVQNKFENGKWDMVKADYCLKNGVSLHLDDTMIYNDFFKTPFARFWSHSGQMKSSHKSMRHID